MVQEYPVSYKSPSQEIGEKAFCEIVRQPKRPLGPVSDYVVEVLPNRLKQIREGGVNSAEQLEVEVMTLLDGIDISQLPEEELKLALLDLAFLEAGFHHSGSILPPKLMVITEACAARLDSAPTLTYEGYILTNPLDEDPRLFLNDEGAEHELFFCQIHRQIEIVLKPLFDMLMNLYDEEPIDKTKFEEGVNKMKTVSQIMSKMNQFFSGEAFRIFRRYLSSNTIRGLPGPSGAFSAAFPALDQLLLDEALRPTPSEEKDFRLWPKKENDKQAYVGWEDVIEARGKRAQRSKLLESLFAADLKNSVIQLLGFLASFRGKHQAAVKKFTPEVWEGTAQPTAALGEFYEEVAEGDDSSSPVKRLLVEHRSKVLDTIDSLHEKEKNEK